MIAIVTILAGLLLPALSSARQKAHSIKCLGNQRQIGLEFRMALMDDSRFANPAVGQFWAYRVGLAQAGWICPTAPTNRSRAMLNELAFGSTFTAWRGSQASLLNFTPGLPTRADIPAIRASSYTLNVWLLDGADAPGVVQLKRSTPHRLDQRSYFENESQVTFPDQTPLLWDGVYPFVGPIAADFPARNLKEPWHETLGLSGAQHNEPHGACIPRHGSRPSRLPANHPVSATLPGAVNAAFYDGHVELVKLERIWQLHWHKDYVPPVKRPGL